jgi:DNA-directed RNA polymerase specialized sigma24 family protein
MHLLLIRPGGAFVKIFLCCFKVSFPFIRLLYLQARGIMQTMAAKRQQNILQAVSDYGRRLFAFIRSRAASAEDAEDILQEEIETIESISGWLIRLARNLITRRGRKRTPRLPIPLPLSREILR